MPVQPTQSTDLDHGARCFGIRIENQRLQIAIATPGDNGRYQLQIDEVECPETSGWLTAAGAPLLAKALESLVERHEMRRHRVAMSLDGHFCVTRVSMGTAEEVDRELAMQADRIPRYLQLGPGEKVTGSARTKISSSMDYAVMGVVNRSLIQLVYDSIRAADIDVSWVEPSLVSVARMLGQADVGGDEPVMIADGTGSQWDVGIACAGRLLLDYRPAGATNEQGLRNALDGHIIRLQRFCLRHRGVATGELERLMICGSGDKPQRAIEVLGDHLGVKPEILRVPNLTRLYELDRDHRESRSVPAVATVLPLLMNVGADEVPDLLCEVRREPDLPLAQRLARSLWPVVAAVLLLCMTYGLLHKQRHHTELSSRDLAQLQSEIASTAARFDDLTGKRELLNHLRRVEEQTRETDWSSLLSEISQNLPAPAKLNQYRVESDGQVVLDGAVLKESAVYDVINALRRLPRISHVALTGTAPDSTTEGTRFMLELDLRELPPAEVMTNQNERETN